MLTLKNITKKFGGVSAVDDLSVNFVAGRITALIGPNGAGKTTAFNLIDGLLKPDTGTIEYNGKTISRLKPWQIAQLGIGRLFQDVRLFRKMTVLENVMTAFQKQKGESVWRSIFVPFLEIADEKKRQERAMQLLEKVGLTDKAYSLAENLSYGQQKLAAIARLLAANAEILLLDEPAAGINPVMIKQLLQTVRELTEEGRTIIFIEHNIEVVRSIADEVIFMSAGKKLMSGIPSEVLADKEVQSAYVGFSRRDSVS